MCVCMQDTSPRAWSDNIYLQFQHLAHTTAAPKMAGQPRAHSVLSEPLSQKGKEEKEPHQSANAQIRQAILVRNISIFSLTTFAPKCILPKFSSRCFQKKEKS